jgi:parvulin-like peptidyl-prolyl isomerase
MKWHSFIASAAVVGLVAGCQAQQPVAPVVRADVNPPAVQRSQKPETDLAKPETAKEATPKSLLDAPIEQVSAVGSDARPAAVILATVNGVPILEQEVLSMTSSTSPEDIDRTLNMLIEREVILQEAYAKFNKGGGIKYLEKLKEAAAKEFDRQFVVGTKKKMGFKTDDEFKKWLSTQQDAFDGLRRQFERQFIYQQYIQFAVGATIDRIGREDLLAYYEQHPEEFQTVDNVVWQDIFVAVSSHPSRDAARQFAQQLVARVRGGEDFVRLGTQYDNGDSTYRGGQGFGHHRGEIKPREVEPVVFRMKEGDLEVVELTNGFHVVHLVKRENAGMTPFDEKTQGTIRDKLKNEVYAREAKKVIAALRRKATIEVAKKNP